MRDTSLIRALILCSLQVPVLITLTGCSFLFVTAPDKELSRRPIDQDCTTTKAAPIIDTVFASLLLIGFSGRLAADAYFADNADESAGAAFFVDLASLGILTGSSIYGYATTASCSDIKERFRVAQARKAGERTPRLAQKVKVPEARTSDPPRQIAGFAFNSAIVQAQDACIGAGGTWDTSPNKATCNNLNSRIENVQQSVTIEFRHERVKRIKVTHETSDKNAPIIRDLYLQAESALTTTYGKPHHRIEHIPPDCRMALAECLRDHRAMIAARWLWPSSFEVSADLRATEDQVVMTFDNLDVTPFDPLDLQRAPVTIEPQNRTQPSQLSPTTNAAVQVARISIKSLPGSNVVVDGKPLGSTPVTWSGDAGTHQVLVVHPQYGKKLVSVDLRAGQLQELTVSFP